MGGDVVANRDAGRRRLDSGTVREGALHPVRPRARHRRHRRGRRPARRDRPARPRGRRRMRARRDVRRRCVSRPRNRPSDHRRVDPPRRIAGRVLRPVRRSRGALRGGGLPPHRAGGHSRGDPAEARMVRAGDRSGGGCDAVGGWRLAVASCVLRVANGSRATGHGSVTIERTPDAPPSPRRTFRGTWLSLSRSLPPSLPRPRCLRSTPRRVRAGGALRQWAWGV